jgi:hypothetical protein
MFIEDIDRVHGDMFLRVAEDDNGRIYYSVTERRFDYADFTHAYYYKDEIQSELDLRKNLKETPTVKEVGGVSPEQLFEAISAPLYGVRKEVWNRNEGGYVQNIYRLSPTKEALFASPLDIEAPRHLRAFTDENSLLVCAVIFNSDKDPRIQRVFDWMRSIPEGVVSILEPFDQEDSLDDSHEESSGPGM